MCQLQASTLSLEKYWKVGKDRHFPPGAVGNGAEIGRLHGSKRMQNNHARLTVDKSSLVSFYWSMMVVQPRKIDNI